MYYEIVNTDIVQEFVIYNKKSCVVIFEIIVIMDILHFCGRIENVVKYLTSILNSLENI